MNAQPRGEKGFVSRRIGAPPRSATLRELVNSPDRILQRVQLVDVGYREALAGNVRWAQWLAQVGGEWTANTQVNVLADSPFAQAIDALRVALGNEPMFGTGVLGTGADAVDAEAHVVSEDANANPPTP